MAAYQIVLTQLVQDAFVKGWVDEVLVRLSLEHRDKDLCRPPPDLLIIAGQVIYHDCDHSGAYGYEETMSGSADHIEHHLADANCLAIFSGRVQKSLKDVKSAVYELFTEFLDQASHASQAHVLQLG